MQRKIAIPSDSECMALLSKYAMPENIVAHSIAVSKIAVLIAEKIKARGETASERCTPRIRRRSGGSVDVPLVRAGALLHDIDKIVEIKNKSGRHGIMAREILEKEGYPEIAKIAERHVLYKILEEGKKFNLEEKIIFYADKRVRHEKVVSLDERFKYLRERYPQYLDSINRAEPLAKELEKKLMKMAGLSADEI